MWGSTKPRRGTSSFGARGWAPDVGEAARKPCCGGAAVGWELRPLEEPG